jgi:hypothetical protein
MFMRPPVVISVVPAFCWTAAAQEGEIPNGARIPLLKQA